MSAADRDALRDLLGAVEARRDRGARDLTQIDAAAERTRRHLARTDRTWDRLLAASHPGQEVEIGPDRWLITRRAWHQQDVHAGRTNAAELRVTFVRSGTRADPRPTVDDLSTGEPPL